MDTTLYVFTLLLCTVCYGQVHNSTHRENTNKIITNPKIVTVETQPGTTYVTPDSPSIDMVRMLVPLAVSVANFAIIFCLIYNGCFKCTRVKSQGQVLASSTTLHQQAVIPPLEKPAALQDNSAPYEMKSMWNAPTSMANAAGSKYVNVQFGDEKY